MLQYIVKRTILALFTMMLVSFLVFMVIQLPEGDYVDAYIRDQLEHQIMLEPPTEYEEFLLREQFGLNRPILVQYGSWIYKIAVYGDFGHSYRKQKPIKELIEERLFFTMVLSAATSIFIFLFTIPVGIYSAVRQHSVGDYVFTFLGFTGLAVPDFLLGLVLMYLFLSYFKMSVGGLFSGHYIDQPWSYGRVIDLLQHLIIPMVVLGTAGMAGGIRILRNNLLDELQKPYVVTARSKGTKHWRVVAKYPFRISVNPMISGIGGILPGLIGSSVIVSIVLSLPTLGPLLLEALMMEDMFLAGTIILLLSALTVVGVLISDLMLVFVDPRIKMTG